MDSYKTVLTAGFKYGSKNGTTISEGLSRQNDGSSERLISVGYVPQIVRTIVTFEFKESKTSAGTSDIT